MEKPLVSIIIPTYNRAHLIGETLDSVLAQTYENWECIVVDDGSTDKTDEVMARYCAKDSRFRYYHRPDEHKPGGNGARNYGFLMSKGEYVQWFDSDDIMLPQFFEYKIIQFREGIDLIITTGFECGEYLEAKEKVDLKIEKDLFTDYALWKLKVFTPSVLFRKSFLEGNELFNESLLRGQETEFFCRIFARLRGNSFLLENEALFLYRRHQSTKSQQNKTYIPGFKRSQALIALQNIKLSLEKDNVQVKEKAMLSSLKFFFLSLSHNDNLTSKYIHKEMGKIIRKKSFWKYCEFYLLGFYLMNFSKGRYFIKSKWIKENYFL